MTNNELLEPELLYKNQLKEKHHQNVLEEFESLEKKSKIDVVSNNATCTKYYKNLEILEKHKKSLNKLKGLLFLFIAMIIIGFIGLIVGLVMSGSGNNLAILFFILGPVLMLAGIFLIVGVYKNKKTNLNKQINKYTILVNELQEEAYKQMAPLNSLFSASIPSKLFQKTCPLFEMDRIFDVKKYEMMKDKYGLWDNTDPSFSTLDIQSGSILGNPFVIFKDLNMQMVDHKYTGTTVISYTVGSGQNRRTVTETLTATHTAPEPVYSKETYLVYANEAAQKLSFSREPSNPNITTMSDEEIRKYVRKHEEDLDKFAHKQMKKGGTFTPIGNPEFELFFGGLDRDSEVEFRLLFTALGQKSMMQVLKSKVGYGDDFSFKKTKGLNIIQSKHSQGDVLFLGPDGFRGFDFEAVKKYFISFNDNYFKALFFDFAPLLSIPLYQQTKSHEYIYKDTYKSNFSPFEHEVLANMYKNTAFADLMTKTAVILKTNILKKEENSDIVTVTANSFNKIKKIENVSVFGGDGRMHTVPVEWIDYIPLKKETVIHVGDVETDDEAKFKKFGNKNVIYAKGLVSGIGNQLNVDINKIKSAMKKD